MSTESHAGNRGPWWKDEPELWLAAAFRRDWEKLKRISALAVRPALHPPVLQQISYGALAYESVEPAYRFGYAAGKEYRSAFPEWREELETRLQNDWSAAFPDFADCWHRYRDAVQRGFQLQNSKPFI